MSEYEVLKAERNRLKKLYDSVYPSLRKTPNGIAVKAKYDECCKKIKALFKENI